MKNPRIIFATMTAFMAFATGSFAQQADLVQDQNPRYESSRAKYMNVADSLTSTQGTTVQNTYQAYDWYEAREARRKLRREQNAQYSSWYYPSAYYSPAYNNWGYHNWNYGYGGRRNWRQNNFWLGW